MTNVYRIECSAGSEHELLGDAHSRVYLTREEAEEGLAHLVEDAADFAADGDARFADAAYSVVEIPGSTALAEPVAVLVPHQIPVETCGLADLCAQEPEWEASGPRGERDDDAFPLAARAADCSAVYRLSTWADVAALARRGGSHQGPALVELAHRIARKGGAS